MIDKIPQNVLSSLVRLNEAGYEAYIVGGAVRDILMKKTPFDFDITTSATPIEVKKVFEGERIIETGIKHGTVTVVIDEYPLEITTFRKDGDYVDHRHPSGVTFEKDVREDLKRRDFTINALALSAFGELKDEFLGREDIENGIIRAIGNPKERFTEDALRIMRALRFSATLGFMIEEETKKAIFELKNLLSGIAKERILAELEKLILGKNAVSVINEFADVLGVFMPKPQDFSEEFIKAKGFSAKMFCLLKCYGIDEAKKALLSLKAKRKTIEDVAFLFTANMPETLFEAKCFLKDYGVEKKEILFDFYGEKELQKSLFEKAEAEPYKITHLKVTGADIMELGFSGEAVGRELMLLLEKVMKGEVENEREKLILAVKMNI